MFFNLKTMVFRSKNIGFLKLKRRKNAVICHNNKQNYENNTFLLKYTFSK